MLIHKTSKNMVAFDKKLSWPIKLKSVFDRKRFCRSWTQFYKIYDIFDRKFPPKTESEKYAPTDNS